MNLSDLTNSTKTGNKTFETKVKQYVADLHLDATNLDCLWETVQRPDCMAYNAYIPLQYLADALDECQDQLPLNPLGVRRLLDGDYGLLKGNVLEEDVRIGYATDNINEETGEAIDPDVFSIIGGRHRIALLMLICDLAGVGYDLLVRVVPSEVRNKAHATLRQQLDNTSRTMTSTEKTRIKVESLDVKVQDAGSVIDYAIESGKSSAVTDCYRIIFSDFINPLLTFDTLGKIGGSFIKEMIATEPEKALKATLRMSTSLDKSEVITYHMALVEAAEAVLPAVLENFEGNMARQYVAIAASMVDMIRKSA